LSNYSPAGEIGARTNGNDAFAWTAGITGSRAYTINGLNQFATVAGATQGYAGRGNLISSGGVTYAYTSENLLETAGIATLAYDLSAGSTNMMCPPRPVSYMTAA
jgi:hypothetical protein